MRHFWILTLTGLFLLASCGSPSSSSIHSNGALPLPFTGRVRTTTILSEGMDIAVMVASPQTASLYGRRRSGGGRLAHLY